MGRTVYVNGEFVAEEDAKISVFDRGFLFADAIYEVSSVLHGKLVDNNAHHRRLQRSMDELNMPRPATDDEITAIQEKLIEKNNLKEGIVYMQISRGPADRDFVYPADPKPSLVLFTQEMNLLNSPKVAKGLSIITLPDIRWARRDIKTVGLLAPSMAKQMAVEAGADDAWMVEDGFVTEGTSNNAFIVTKDGKIITRHLGNEILHGITRAAVMELAEQENLEIEERSFTVEEAKNAREAFVTSASNFVMPVVKIDDQLLGNGGPGILTGKLRKLYLERALTSVS